jgi:HEAT repeat protein
MAKLLSSLASPELAIRKKAATELEELGEVAEGPLRNFLDTKPALEIRQRIEQILDKRKAEVIRGIRAIEALEQIGTPEALQELEALAKDSHNPRLASAATGAVARLNRR